MGYGCVRRFQPISQKAGRSTAVTRTRRDRHHTQVANANSPNIPCTNRQNRFPQAPVSRLLLYKTLSFGPSSNISARMAQSLQLTEISSRRVSSPSGLISRSICPPPPANLPGRGACPTRSSSGHSGNRRVNYLHRAEDLRVPHFSPNAFGSPMEMSKLWTSLRSCFPPEYRRWVQQSKQY